MTEYTVLATFRERFWVSYWLGRNPLNWAFQIYTDYFGKQKAVVTFQSPVRLSCPINFARADNCEPPVYNSFRRVNLAIALVFWAALGAALHAAWRLF